MPAALQPRYCWENACLFEILQKLEMEHLNGLSFRATLPFTKRFVQNFQTFDIQNGPRFWYRRFFTFRTTLRISLIKEHQQRLAYWMQLKWSLRRGRGKQIEHQAYPKAKQRTVTPAATQIPVSLDDSYLYRDNKAKHCHVFTPIIIFCHCHAYYQDEMNDPDGQMPTQSIGRWQYLMEQYVRCTCEYSKNLVNRICVQTCKA